MIRRFAPTLFRLLHPFAPTGYPDSTSSEIRSQIEREFADIFSIYPLSAAAFREFKSLCGYAESYVNYMGPDLLDQKMLEHFVSQELIRLPEGGTLLDIGGAQSPFARYVQREHAATAYALDPGYAAGIHGNQIGSRAESIPLPDASVDAMTLHCSIDHFEGDGDSRFIREAARVLRPGGRVCILPLYFAPEPTNICDPSEYALDITFDPDAVIRRVDGHRNRFGRFYTVKTLRTRLLDPPHGLRPTLYRIGGDQPEIPNNYLPYALVVEKRQKETRT